MQSSKQFLSESEAIFLLLMHCFRRPIKIVMEQPVSSFLFKMPLMKEVVQTWAFLRVHTCLGLFGMDILKPTHLMTNLADVSYATRRGTKAAKAKFAKRIARKHARLRKAGKIIKTYYLKLPNGKFQGGPNLGETSTYPKPFAHALYKSWECSRQALKRELE